MNDCFAYKREWNDFEGKFYDKPSMPCCALNGEWAKAYQKSGVCGTLECPFYKPVDSANIVRIGDVFWEE